MSEELNKELENEVTEEVKEAARIFHCHGRGLDYSGQCCVHAVFTELRNRGFYRKPDGTAYAACV